jgi:uncharacterized cupredoxin-like copper-binding protein
MLRAALARDTTFAPRMSPPSIAILSGALIAAGACVIAHSEERRVPTDWSRAERVEIGMVDYEFIPREIRFRHGQPYRLHLVNAGTEGHDLTAADFFASAKLKNTDAFNESGTSVYLSPQQTTDIYFVAPNPGLFAPRCADHDWAGMTATIIID